jgi:hypothetical protein
MSLNQYSREKRILKDIKRKGYGSSMLSPPATPFSGAKRSELQFSLSLLQSNEK